jgi:hypothetical protein
MRLPRVRFTIRRLMLAVAVVALLVGMAIESEWRRVRFHKLVQFYWWKQANPHFPYLSATYEDWESITRRLPRLGPYYAAMRAKYEFAERYPWLPVAPDPPEPE